MTSRLPDTIPAPLHAALERRGFSQLTQVQEAALEVSGEARDLQISSQTGSGKTVALGFVTAPTLLASDAPNEGGPAVLVIVPTRELAAQVSSELGWLYANVPAVKVECVTGGTNSWQERKRLRFHPRIVVGTPGRLLDHLKSGALELGAVGHLVLDEADQMLDMGFREELEAILDATPSERRTHLVSATFPIGIRRLAERYQRDPQHIEGTELGVANEDIEHVAYRVHECDRYAALVNLLLLGGHERTLLFVNTRAETSKVAERLSEDGFAALPLSGELVQAQRTRTLAAFKSGAVSVLVATDVASRGLDIPEVATVIHGDPGLDGEVYTHRSGRTGRAGRKGRSLMLVTPRTERRARRLLGEAGVEVEWRSAPNAGLVAKQLEKEARRATWAALDGADEPPAERLAEAGRLLEGRDPAAVVATLLEMTRPASSGTAPRELERPPRDIPAVAPKGARWKDERGTNGAHKNGFVKGAGAPDRRRGPLPPVEAGTTRFWINWGAAEGATPKRILAHVCRRGALQGRDVGAIRIQDNGSTFDVQQGVAKAFEVRVQARDRRDPHLRIQKAWDASRPKRPALARAE